MGAHRTFRSNTDLPRALTDWLPKRTSDATPPLDASRALDPTSYARLRTSPLRTVRRTVPHTAPSIPPQTKLYFLDGGEEYRATTHPDVDPPVPQTSWILSQVPNGGAPFTVAETFKLNLARETFRARLAAHWNATSARTRMGRPVDAVLCPAAATLAPPHDSTRWWGYTAYWNLADFPAAVFPAGPRFCAAGYRPRALDAHAGQAHAHVHARGPSTRVGGEGQGQDDGQGRAAGWRAPVHAGPPRNPTEAFVCAQWDPVTYDGAAVGLQLVGRRLNEERLLGVLARVEDALRAFDTEA